MPFTMPDPRNIVPLVYLTALADKANFQNTFYANTTDYRIGGVFRSTYNDYCTGCRIGSGNNVGTQTGIMTVELYNVDSQGKPTGDILASKSGITSTSYAWLDITWDTPCFLETGKSYAIVAKNTAAVPASNYFKICGDMSSGNYLKYARGWCYGVQSANAGTSWFFGTSYDVFILPKYQNSALPAYMMSSYSYYTTSLALYNVDSSRIARVGVCVNLPQPMRLWEVIFNNNTDNGSPTFNLQAEVCSSSASLAVSTKIIPVTNTGYLSFWFDGGYVLNDNTDYYITLRPYELTNGSVTMDSANYGRISHGYGLQNTYNVGIFKGAVESTAVNPSFSFTTRSYFVDLVVEPLAPKETFTVPLLA